MEVLLLSRIQFALTIMFHYLFPPLSIGLGAIMVLMEGAYLYTGDVLYHRMTKFWSRVFAVGPDIHALAGRRPRRLLARRSRAGARAALYRESTLATVDVRSGFEPLAVTGRIVGAHRPVRRNVAVAVDGVIRATGRTFHLAHRRL